MVMKMEFGNFCGTLWRKKQIVASSLLDTKLNRCLGLLDLIGFGLGTPLGLGVYVVTSYAITYQTGPSFVISVIVAGVASLFAGLCYAEFSARLPRAGSAYLYSYVTLGELYGFVIGWNMILEHILTASLAAKAWSQYLDFMLNGTINQFLTDSTDWGGGAVIGDHPDLVASALLVLITLIAAMGIKVSTTLNLMFVFFNMLIVMCFICIGYFHVKHENWTDPPGFFAHGFSGILNGAATLFFTFANFEVITCCSEETKEPTRNLPSAILYTVFTSSAVYFGVATAATLSLHEFHMSDAVALPRVLQTLHIHGASSVIVIGGLLGLLASVICACTYLPRMFYAMSCDKLLFGFLSIVKEKSKVPVYSVLVSGGISSVVALVFRFEVLLEIVSLGTLLAYTSVSICVICQRYQQGSVGLYMEYEDPNDADFIACTDFTYADFPLDASKQNATSSSQNHSKQHMNGQAKLYHERSKLSNGYNQLKTPLKRTMSLDDASKLTSGNIDITRPRESTYRRMESVISSTSAGSVSGLFRLPSDTILEPTENTWKKCAIGLLVFIISAVLLCVIALYMDSVLQLDSWWILLVVVMFALILIISAVLVVKQPQNLTKLYFMTPYVPCVPLISILINISLLVSLSQYCWLRFLLWMIPGLALYACYSRRHSSERQIDEQEVVLYEITDDTNEHSS